MISETLFYVIEKSCQKTDFRSGCHYQSARKENHFKTSNYFTGFVYVKASRDLMKESSNMIETIVEKHLESNDFEWSKLKQDIRDQLGRYLFEQTKRRPVILPVIMEATQRRNKK